MTLSNNKRITSASPRCVNNGCSSSSDGRGSLSLVCTKRRLILLALLFTLHLSLFSSASAQYTDNVGIGTATPDPSALLELRSTEKGFLITRMSLQQRDALQLPATGLMIYNTTAGSFQYNIGTPVAPIWVSMLYINIDGGSSSGVFWSLVGNDSVDATRNFLGTINDRPLIIKTDSVTRMIFQPTGEINMYAPTFISGSLDLTGDTTSLLMNGQAGAPGSPLVSRGPGLTPEWSVAMNIADTLIRVTAPAEFTGETHFIDTATFDLQPQFPLSYGHILIGDSNDRAVPLPPGLEGSLMQVEFGEPRWVSPDQANYWSLSGNAGIGATDFIGTTDANDLRLVTNGTLRATITAGGTFDIQMPTQITGSLSLMGPTSPLSLNGNEGNAGQVLISNGVGQTPRYTDTLTLSQLTVTGQSHFIDTSRFDLLPVFPLNSQNILVGDSTNIAKPLVPGSDSTFLAIMNGQVLWFDLGLLLRNTAWIVGGNYGVSSSILGNKDTAGIRDVDIWAGGRSIIFTDGTQYSIDLRGPVNLDGDSISLSMNGVPGAMFQVLQSMGPGVTPKWTDSLTLATVSITGDLSVAGESHFIDTATFDLLPKFPLTHGYILVGDSNDLAAPLAPGLEGALMQIQFGQPTWVSPDQANYWSLSGNAGIGATDFLGTQDANDLRLATNGTLRATITATGIFDVVIPTQITGSLSLMGATSPLALNGNEGNAGQVLISQGAGNTPTYTDTLTLSNLTVTGTSRFIELSSFDVLPEMPLQKNYILLGDDNNLAAPFAPGADSTVLAVMAGDVTWLNIGKLLTTDPWLVGGNAPVASEIFGNLDSTGTLRNVDVRAGGKTMVLYDGTSYTTKQRTPFNLDGNNVPLQLNGNAGTSGQVLISQGAGTTPRYTDTLTLSNLTVTGESRFIELSSFDVFPKFPLQHGYIIVGDSNDIGVAFPPGLEGSILQIDFGTPKWVTPDQSAYWSLSGNAGIAATSFLGTTDANDLRFATNGTLRATLTATGVLDVVVPTQITGSLSLMGANSPLAVNGDEGNQFHVLMSNGAGNTPLWFNIEPFLTANDWRVGGNDSVTSAILGNNDNVGAIRDVDLRAGGQTMVLYDGTNMQANQKVTFNLDGNNVPLELNGDAGLPNEVLVSRGPGLTPEYTDTLTLANLTVTGESHFVELSSFDVFPKFPLLHGYMIVGDTNNIAVPFAPGLEGSTLTIEFGEPTWVTPDQSSYWSLSGNTGIGATDFLGTNDANDLRLVTNANIRATISAATGDVSINTLSGAPSLVPLGPNEGIVVADGGGTLTKRDKSLFLSELGVARGRYTNAGAAPEYTVVITTPVGFTLDAQAAIVITPEATVSVSITPFIVNGSRTANSFTINFPGGLNPGESINWICLNP